MPTAPKTSATTAKPRAKAARKPTAAKAKATAAKSARTRALHSAESTAKQTQTATRETAGVFGDYAERAVLIPVGAALIARERVVSTVSDTVSNYSSSTKAQAQLRRFERRGATARKRLEREVRKARVRVERELRQRRKEIETTVNDTFSGIDARRERITKNSTELANRVPEFVDQVQERILSLV
jgi:argonaute-like protein implicated in RNA metabolism and viral defense